MWRGSRAMQALLTALRKNHANLYVYSKLGLSLVRTEVLVDRESNKMIDNI